MEKQREAFLAKAGAMYDKAITWREAHQEASFDEIVAKVGPQRRALMGELLKVLALQAGNGAVAEGKACEQCGEAMRYKGELKRAVLNGEGDSVIERAHYYCPRCQSGVFPPGPAAKVGRA